MRARKQKLLLRQETDFFVGAQKKLTHHWILYFDFKAKHGPELIVIIPKKILPKASQRSVWKRKLYQALASCQLPQHLRLALVLQRSATHIQAMDILIDSLQQDIKSLISA